MKKFLAIILALVMVFSLAACGNADNPGDNTQQPGSSNDPNAGATGGTSVGSDGTVTTNYDAIDDVDPAAKDDLPHFDVLVLYSQFTDKLGSQYKSSIEFICEQLNCTPTFTEFGVGEEAMNIVQAALVNHYDFALGWSTDEGILKLFQEAGVPYVVVGTVIPDDTVAQMVRNYDMFMGCVGVDDYGAMVEGAKSLYAAGCRNVIWNGLPLGFAGQHDLRLHGFEDTAAELGMNLLTENMDYTAWPDGIANAAAAYPELDGIGATALNESIYNTIVSEGLTNQVKVCGIDITESTGDAFDAGYLAYIAGGNYACMQLAFAVGYNYALDGTRVIADPGTNLLMHNIDIHNREEFDNYIKYLDGGVPAWTAQEILEMTNWYQSNYKDSSFTANDILTVADSFTLDNVMTRHAELFK